MVRCQTAPIKPQACETASVVMDPILRCLQSSFSPPLLPVPRSLARRGHSAPPLGETSKDSSAQPASKSRRLDDFCEVHRDVVLGRGTFGVVYKGYLKKNSRADHRSAVAVKIMDKFCMKARHISPKMMANEVEMMRACGSHRNCVQFVDSVDTGREFALVLEYCSGGSLQEAVEKRGAVGESQVRVLMEQMMTAVSFIHGRHIIHRDVKPHNFMLDGSITSPDVVVKLGDFGLAVRIQLGTLLKRQVGTRAFMSPEMHLLPNKSPGYDQKADIWALGVCLVFLFANEHPFLDGSGILLRQKLISGEVPLWDVSGFGGLFKRVAKAAGVCRQRPSRPAQALMRVLLDPRREKRPWASDALKCEWFTTPLSELDVSDEVPLLNWADFEAGIDALEREITQGVARAAAVVAGKALGSSALSALELKNDAPSTPRSPKPPTMGRQSSPKKEAKDAKGAKKKGACLICASSSAEVGYICWQCRQIICISCIQKMSSTACPQCRPRFEEPGALISRVRATLGSNGSPVRCRRNPEVPSPTHPVDPGSPCSRLSARTVVGVRGVESPVMRSACRHSSQSPVRRTVACSSQDVCPVGWRTPTQPSSHLSTHQSSQHSARPSHPSGLPPASPSHPASPSRSSAWPRAPRVQPPDRPPGQASVHMSQQCVGPQRSRAGQLCEPVRQRSQPQSCPIVVPPPGNGGYNTCSALSSWSTTRTATPPVESPTGWMMVPRTLAVQ